MVLIITAENRLYVADTIKAIQLHIYFPDLTVEMGLNAIKGSGYDRCYFSTTGQGCRYWISEVKTFLRSRNYVTDDGQLKKARGGWKGFGMRRGNRFWGT